MSIIAPYCVSEEEAGEPGDSSWDVGGESHVGSAQEGSVSGRTMCQKVISVSSSSPLNIGSI